MNFIKIKVEDVSANSSNDIEPGYKRIPYVKRDDGWYVNSERVNGIDGFRLYAHSDADEMDVRQLLKKECDIRY
jgi:hypothetical protein